MMASKPIELIPNQRLLTANDIAKHLNVRASTVYEWARMDYIPHFRFGTGKKKPCVRFRWSAVEKWLEQMEHPGRLTRVPEFG